MRNLLTPLTKLNEKSAQKLATKNGKQWQKIPLKVSTGGSTSVREKFLLRKDDSENFGSNRL
jgi:hypothetical protein